MIDSDNVVTTARHLFEAQAEEIAKYKQLATAAIDDAVVLRAQLAALQCKDELPEFSAVQDWWDNGSDNHELFSETVQAYARQAQAMVRAKMVPLTQEQIGSAQWDDGAGSSADFREGVRYAERAHGITGEPK